MANGLDYCMSCSWWTRFGCIAETIPDRLPKDRMKPLRVIAPHSNQGGRGGASVSRNLSSHRRYLVASGKASLWHSYRSVEEAWKSAGL